METVKREIQTWTRKVAGKKIKYNTLSPQGDLKKAREALVKAQITMGIAKEVMSQVEALHNSSQRQRRVLIARASTPTLQTKRKVFIQKGTSMTKENQ